MGCVAVGRSGHTWVPGRQGRVLGRLRGCRGSGVLLWAAGRECLVASNQDAAPQDPAGPLQRAANSSLNTHLRTRHPRMQQECLGPANPQACLLGGGAGNPFLEQREHSLLRHPPPRTIQTPYSWGGVAEAPTAPTEARGGCGRSLGPQPRLGANLGEAAKEKAPTRGPGLGRKFCSPKDGEGLKDRAQKISRGSPACSPQKWPHPGARAWQGRSQENSPSRPAASVPLGPGAVSLANAEAKLGAAQGSGLRSPQAELPAVCSTVPRGGFSPIASSPRGLAQPPPPRRLWPHSSERPSPSPLDQPCPPLALSGRHRPTHLRQGKRRKGKRPSQ